MTSKAGDRAASEVLGFVLLIAIVVAGITSVLVLGGTALSGTQSEVFTRQAESAFSEVDAQASEVALMEGPNTRVVDLGLQTQSKASVYVQNNTRVRIIARDIYSGDTKVVLNETVGTLKYRRGKTVISYQTGGVFTKTEGIDNSSRIVTPPEFEYSDATLTMPLVTVSGNSSPSKGKIKLTRESSVEPANLTGRIVGKRVFIEIRSTHYVAWAEFFRKRIEGEVNVTLDRRNNTVSVKLGRSEALRPSFDQAFVANGDVDGAANAEIIGPVTSSGSVDDSIVTGEVNEDSTLEQSVISSFVTSTVSRAEGNWTDLGTLSSSTTLGPGKYYVDNIDLKNSKVVLNPDEGNVSIAVDEDVELTNNAEIKVKDSNEAARIFVEGDVKLKNGKPKVLTEGTVKDMQIYGTEETDVLISQASTFEGLIYAPTTFVDTGNPKGNKGGSKCKKLDHTVCIGANARVKGAIVSGAVRISNSARFEYPEEVLDGFRPSIRTSTSAPKLFYLHASVNPVRVEG